MLSFQIQKNEKTNSTIITYLIMGIIDYIFIFCCILGVYAILVSIIHPLIPKEMLFESKEINIKRGKILVLVVPLEFLCVIIYQLMVISILLNNIVKTLFYCIVKK